MKVVCPARLSISSQEPGAAAASNTRQLLPSGLEALIRPAAAAQHRTATVQVDRRPCNLTQQSAMLAYV